MKRKLVTLFLACTIVASGCNSAAPTVSTDVSSDQAPSESRIAAESFQESVQSEINDIADNYTPQETTQSLADVCAALETAGVVSGSQTKMAGEMIGAISGLKYADSKVEIYEYDTSSEKYQALAETGKVSVEGFNVEMTASAINGAYVLFCESAENKADVIDAFSKLGTK